MANDGRNSRELIRKSKQDSANILATALNSLLVPVETPIAFLLRDASRAMIIIVRRILREREIIKYGSEAEKRPGSQMSK